MPAPKAWSFSALDDFINCPKAYYEKKVIKSVQEEQSEQMLWGNTVHKAFEDRLSDGVVLPAALEEHEPYLRRLEDMPGKSFTERKVAMNKRLQICGYFDRDVWNRGVIDFTKVSEAEALVVDYKTGKQHFKTKQLKLFALYIFALHPDVQRVDTRFYWTQTLTATGEQYRRREIPDLWAEFVPDLRQWAQAFKEDIWQERPSGLCNGWCPVRDCRNWKPKRSYQ